MAEGSHPTYGGWEPRTCYLCGNKVTLDAPGGVGFYLDDQTGEARSWHFNCKRGAL